MYFLGTTEYTSATLKLRRGRNRQCLLTPLVITKKNIDIVLIICFVHDMYRRVTMDV